MVVNVSYNFSISFSEAAYNHFFALRIIPKTDERQKPVYIDTNLSDTWEDTDGFGNLSVLGKIAKPHDSFEVSLKSAVEINEKQKPTDKPLDIYLFESRFTGYSDEFRVYANALRLPTNKLQKALYLTKTVYGDFEYKKQSTDVNSDINHLLAQKSGVCQDFSHLLVALLRYNKIPARYINGYIEGDGETHAWVEGYIDGEWIGLDPTHETIVSDLPYVKVAHGRDFADCTVNRGVFAGGGEQKMDINVYVARGEQ